MNAFTTIMRDEGGLRGLWRGSGPAVQVSGNLAVTAVLKKIPQSTIYPELTSSLLKPYETCQLLIPVQSHASWRENHIPIKVPCYTEGGACQPWGACNI